MSNHNLLASSSKSLRSESLCTAIATLILTCLFGGLCRAERPSGIRFRCEDSVGRWLEAHITVKGPVTKRFVTLGGRRTVRLPPGKYIVTFRPRRQLPPLKPRAYTVREGTMGVCILRSRSRPHGEPEWNVRLSIRDVRATSNLEGLGGGRADFYAVTCIGNYRQRESAVIANKNHIQPKWHHQETVRQSAFVSGLQQQERWRRPTIYNHDSFRGFKVGSPLNRERRRVWTLTRSVSNLHGYGWGDLVSSVYVPAGYRLELYEHPNYRGKKLTVKGPGQIGDLKRDRPSRANWGDRISSIGVIKTLGPPPSMGIYLQIKLMEKDGGGRGGDDLVDVTAERGSVLQLCLCFDPTRKSGHVRNLVTARVVGTLRKTGTRSWATSNMSSSGRGGDRASIQFAVSVTRISQSSKKNQP